MPGPLTSKELFWIGLGGIFIIPMIAASILLAPFFFIFQLIKTIADA